MRTLDVFTASVLDKTAVIEVIANDPFKKLRESNRIERWTTRKNGIDVVKRVEAHFVAGLDGR